MHIASKITLILGALIFVGSIAGVAIDGMALTDAGYKEEVYVERSMGQTFTIQENSSWDVSIYVIHPADCYTLELSIVDSDGDRATSDWCALDEGKAMKNTTLTEVRNSMALLPMSSKAWSTPSRAM